MQLSNISIPRKFQFLVFINIPFFLFVACKATNIKNKTQQTYEEYYQIKRFKKSNKDIQKSTLTFNYYDFNDRSKVIPFSFVIINDFIFKDSVVEILPRYGSVDIFISNHLKEDVKIKEMKVFKGDSIIINAFLKDSNTIFYD